MTTPPTSLRYEQCFEWVSVIRSMIEHENTLLNQRMGWMWTLQGLLFGAGGFVWTHESVAFWILAAIGVVSSVSFGYSLARGVSAITGLREQGQQFVAAHPCKPALPPLIGSQSKGLRWLMPYGLLPWVFLMSWFALAVVRLLPAQ